MSEQSLITIITIAILASPIAYIIGELKGLRPLRILAISSLIPTAILVAWGIGSLSRLNYNAWYSTSTQTLIDEICVQLEQDRANHVQLALEDLTSKFHPSYENRSNYDSLVRDCVDRLKHKEQRAPGNVPDDRRSE